MTKLIKFTQFKFIAQIAILSTVILGSFGNSAVQTLPVSAQYGGTGSILRIRRGLVRIMDGLRIRDPYDCGGSIIYGFVEGGVRPYTIDVRLVNKDGVSATINRGVDFAADGQNWTITVSYDRNNASFIPTGNYTITSSVRDTNGATDTEIYTAFIRPASECSNNSNGNNSTNNSSSKNSSQPSSSSSSSAVVVVNQSNNNKTTTLSQTTDAVKVVQTQLLRTGGFAQNNPLLFSSSILVIAFASTLLIRKPKGIKR